MKEQLIHILDQSVCLSRKQMKEYLSGTMLPEETHAAEVHLSSCPLCSMAMEGFEEHSEEALQGIAALNSGFLKEHFANIAPQIHLNSMAPVAAMPRQHSKRDHTLPVWKVSSIAAAVLVAFGIYWFAKSGTDKYQNTSGNIAMSDVPAVKPVERLPLSDGNAIKDQAAPAVITGGTAQVPATNQITEQKSSTEKKEEPKLETNIAKANGLAAVAKPTTNSGSIADASPVMYLPPAASRKEVSDDNETPVKMAAAAPPGAASLRDAEVEDKATKKLIGSESAHNRASMAKATESAEDVSNQTPMEKASESFDKGKWISALSQYKQGMNSGDNRTRRQATLMAARCYLNLGNKASAIQLLQGLANESGPEKRAAKRMLKDLEKE